MAAASSSSLSGPVLDEADTDLALEEEREEEARIREAAEEAAGGDTGYIVQPPRLPKLPKKGGSVLSLAALEAQAQIRQQQQVQQQLQLKEASVALPILGRREEIAATIASHRVTIIEGESTSLVVVRLRDAHEQTNRPCLLAS